MLVCEHSVRTHLICNRCTQCASYKDTQRMRNERNKYGCLRQHTISMFELLKAKKAAYGMGIGNNWITSTNQISRFWSMMDTWYTEFLRKWFWNCAQWKKKKKHISRWEGLNNSAYMLSLLMHVPIVLFCGHIPNMFKPITVFVSKLMHPMHIEWFGFSRH